MTEKNGKTDAEPLKKCFVIMPISDVPDYPPGHFNRVFNHIIVPACKQVGYKAIRADVTSKTNVIIADILKHAVSCDMAICDLSSRNPNVFYELGFRQAFDKKTVLMIDERTARPFDISPIRSFQYSSTLRIDLVEKAISDLVKSLQETQMMKADEANSLLKFLSIDNPASLPKKEELSVGNALILQAIKELSDRMQPNIYLKPRTNSKKDPRNFAILSNDSILSEGDHLMDKTTNEEYGEVLEIHGNSIVVGKKDGSIDFLKASDINNGKLAVMPF